MIDCCDGPKQVEDIKKILYLRLTHIDFSRSARQLVSTLVTLEEVTGIRDSRSRQRNCCSSTRARHCEFCARATTWSLPLWAELLEQLRVSLRQWRSLKHRMNGIAAVGQKAPRWSSSSMRAVPLSGAAVEHVRCGHRPSLVAARRL